MHINGTLEISANNVTVENTLITPPQGDQYGIHNDGTGNIVKFSTITATRRLARV